MANAVDDTEKLTKWARELLRLLEAAKADGVVLKVYGGTRKKFSVTANMVER